MRTPRFVTHAIALGLLWLGAGACEPTVPRYFAPEMPLMVTEDGAGMARAEVDIAFRAPTDDERARMRERSRELGFDVPFIRRQDVSISVQYTITNLSDKPGVAQMFVNGANEFTLYDVAAIQGAIAMSPLAEEAEEMEFWSLIQGTKFMIPARGTLSGNVREDQFVEAALDLDAFGRWMAPYLTVLINDSDRNPAGLDMMPGNLELPQLFKVIVSFQATTPMQLDFLVRVRDDAGVLAEDGDQVYRPRPMTFLPADVAAAQAAADMMMPAMP